jgi:type II secretory pathway pseudopilin PulG
MKPRGISLIEAVVASSILAMASILIVSLFVNQSKIYRQESAQADLNTQKTLFIKYFQEAGEAASAVAVSQSIGGIAYSSSSSTVIFQLPAIDASGDILTAKYDYVVFYKTGGDIFTAAAPDAASARKSTKRLLASNATELIFRYNDSAPQNADTVSAYILLTNGAVQKTAGTSVMLRNK